MKHGPAQATPKEFEQKTPFLLWKRLKKAAAEMFHCVRFQNAFHPRFQIPPISEMLPI